MLILYLLIKYPARIRIEIDDVDREGIINILITFRNSLVMRSVAKDTIREL